MKYSAVLVRITYLAIAVSLLTLVPLRRWYLELLASCGVYLLLVHLALLVVLPFSIGRLAQRRAALLLLLNGALVTYYALPLIDLYRAPVGRAFPNSALVVKILYANVYTANRRFDAFTTLIQKYDPDIVVALETDEAWQQALRERIPARLRTYILETPRKDNFGLSLYSSFPVAGEILRDFGDEISPGFIAPLQLTPERRISIVAMHARPPLSDAAMYHNYLLFRRVSAALRFMQDPVVVVGDLNATPYSPLYRSFESWAGVRSAAEGYGWISTWNARSGWMRFMIDHVLYRGALSVKSYERLGDIGSDHFPLFVEMAVGE